ncbi:MAG: hypothetical protein HW391_330 [Chloroflexi bacterium]|nr:hypothetical protein [Chloroflexota bacterium]
MHVEDLIAGDGVRVGGDGQPLDDPVRAGKAGAICNEAERGAAATRAGDLEEEQVIPPGQEPDPISGDAVLADGAVDAVEERAPVILRTHSGGV